MNISFDNNFYPTQGGNQTYCTFGEHYNQYVYIKKRQNQNIFESSSTGSQKVLVNPNFKTNKVFINPKFSGIQSNTIHVNPRMKANTRMKQLNITNENRDDCTDKFSQNDNTQNVKWHLNPNMKNLKVSPNISQTLPQTIHINPNFKSMVDNQMFKLIPSEKKHTEIKENVPVDEPHTTVLLTKTKLIRKSVNQNKKPKRRNSVKSRYKIVKSSPSTSKKNNFIMDKSKNRYKVDNRIRRKSLTIGKNQKCSYINKCLSIRHLVTNKVIKRTSKNLSIVNISGVVYKKSVTTLRRSSPVNPLITRTPNRRVELLTNYKLIKKISTRKLSGLENAQKKYDNNIILKKFKLVRKISSKNTNNCKVSPKKLKKCNIPCPYYKKFGFCKGKENGKCHKKHDPDQIALCTRFLQGACINENCLLSHNVSPEKMPTCKYYLEGTCFKESCPYLHVKISPKAEVCRDFLEGFCKQAAECIKRHQYLCPDFEKYGDCLKQRCPYPHGKMVRKYMTNKTKFVKKCSDQKNESKKDYKLNSINYENNETDKCPKDDMKEKQRYYVERNKIHSSEIGNESNSSEVHKSENNDKTSKNFVSLQSRPKLGSLPVFIPLGQ